MAMPINATRPRSSTAKHEPLTLIAKNSRGDLRRFARSRADIGSSSRIDIVPFTRNVHIQREIAG